MSDLFQLGYDAFKANPNIDLDTLETMEKDFQKGYRQAQRESISSLKVATVNIKPIEEKSKSKFVLYWKDLKWLTSCEKYGRLGRDERLYPLRVAICKHLEEMYNQDKFTRFRDVQEEMDRVYSILMEEANRLYPDGE